MTDVSLRSTPPPPRQAILPVRVWQQISPSLVPILAVVTALILTVPLMIFTGGRGDIGRGLNIAGTAYSALLEGALGIVINDQVSSADLNLFLTLAADQPLNNNDLRALSRSFTDAQTLGATVVTRYRGAISGLATLDDDALTELAQGVVDLDTVDAALVTANRPLIAELAALPRGDVRDLGEQYGRATSLTAEDRTALAALVPSVATLSDAEMLAALALVGGEGIAKLERLVTALDLLAVNNIALGSPEAVALGELATVEGGAAVVRSAVTAFDILDRAGITDITALAEQIAIVREMYSVGLLSNPDVNAMIATELTPALADNLVVRRPGNRLVVDAGTSVTGVINNNSNTPDDTSDDRPETAYLRLGGSALLFFPVNLETMLVRAIPFIIAGLAVALGFKAGLFNVGAEGQLYAGGIFAVWVGFAPLFDGLPMIFRLALALVGGITGGFLWGAIPGMLKAFTGAHEVITTIMLNYIAVLFVDWMIKSTTPVILLDVTASTPRTPFINEAARLPAFTSLPVWLFFLAGAALLALGLYQRRTRIATNIRYALRPVVDGVLVVVGGLFLAWVGSRGALHVGFVIMLAAVWFTDWFLNRTTLGFELRTVGTNPDAAKYAGMSVPRNTILALALSGALAGLTGAIEIMGVQYNMQPAFFSGLGFDAIAVALLARSNPRNMIPAGLLWGSLLAGAGLMQVRADIAIDLVKIIQALIIMFIAADVIIRVLWRVPDQGDRAETTFIKGWGG